MSSSNTLFDCLDQGKHPHKSSKTFGMNCWFEMCLTGINLAPLEWNEQQRQWQQFNKSICWVTVSRHTLPVLRNALFLICSYSGITHSAGQKESQSGGFCWIKSLFYCVWNLLCCWWCGRHLLNSLTWGSVFLKEHKYKVLLYLIWMKAPHINVSDFEMKFQCILSLCLAFNSNSTLFKQEGSKLVQKSGFKWVTHSSVSDGIFRLWPDYSSGQYSTWESEFGLQRLWVEDVIWIV